MVLSIATKTARKRAANAQYRAKKKKKREKVDTSTGWSCDSILNGAFYTFTHGDGYLFADGKLYDHGGRAIFWDKDSYFVYIRTWLSLYIQNAGKQSLSKNT